MSKIIDSTILRFLIAVFFIGLYLTVGGAMLNTRLFEGLRLKAYRDPVGILTVGYGHNLQSGNNNNIVSLGLDLNAIRHGQPITKEQAEDIYQLDMKDAREIAIRLVPNFYSHPQEVQDILTDLSFNMGEKTLSKFVTTLGLIKEHNYRAAAEALQHSKWYRQVGDRSKAICAELRNL